MREERGEEREQREESREQKAQRGRKGAREMRHQNYNQRDEACDTNFSSVAARCWLDIFAGARREVLARAWLLCIQYDKGGVSKMLAHICLYVSARLQPLRGYRGAWSGLHAGR